MEVILCDCYKKDVKRLQKKCKEKSLEKEIRNYIVSLLKNLPDFTTSNVVLYQSPKFTLFKTRLRGCGKGKRGGFRLIWAVNKKKTKVLFVKLYSKSEIENISTKALIEEFLNCL